jgi:hypothetical protein
MKVFIVKSVKCDFLNLKKTFCSCCPWLLLLWGDPIGLFEAFGNSSQTLARNLQDQV